MSTLASSILRCESKPADLPKKATLPSIREDTLSCLDEELVSRWGWRGKDSLDCIWIFCRGSTSSHSKLSHEDSFRSFGNVPKKVKSNTFKSILNSNKIVDDDSKPESSPKEPLPKHSILERLTSKSSGKSENSEKEETVKFELVEDLRLITIPITTCLMVLISYIVCGAAIFSAWEVGRKRSKLFSISWLFPTGLDLSGWCILLLHQSDDYWVWWLCAG